MRIAIVPGSFDPITLGHVDLIERAAGLFDMVIAVAMVNEAKTYLFSREERVELMKKAIEHVRTATVDFSSGMLWQYAAEKNACAIVKGIRGAEDVTYEMEMARFNSEKYPEADTVFLPAKPEFLKISSSFIKKSFTEGNNVTTMIPRAVLTALHDKIRK